MKKTLLKLRSTETGSTQVSLAWVSSAEVAKECVDFSSEVIQASISEWMSLKKTVNYSEMSEFFKNLNRFVKIGAPLIDSLKICAAVSKKPFFKGILCEIVHEMRFKGIGMASVIARDYISVFGDSTTAIMQSAEVSGKIGEVFSALSARAEVSRRLSKEMKAAMIHPICMLIFALICVLGILVFVIPTVTAAFSGMDIELPALTVFLMQLSSALRNNAIIMSLCALFPIFAIFLIKKIKGHGKLLREFGAKIPILSNFIKQVSLLDGFMVIALMIRSGTDLVESHALAVRAVSLDLHQQYFSFITDKIRSGSNLVQAYQRAAPILGNTGAEIAMLVQVGDRTGALADVLEQIAEGFDEGAQISAKALPKVIQPFLMVFIFAVVGLMALAIYLPQIQMVIKTLEK